MVVLIFTGKGKDAIPAMPMITVPVFTRPAIGANSFRKSWKSGVKEVKMSSMKEEAIAMARHKGG